MPKLSIIIPIKNEADNLSPLLARIENTLTKASLSYEVIFIDDCSTDDSARIIAELQKKYPIKYYLKKGRPGKAFSILEGSEYAESEHLVMLDADLQYPPEVLPQMVAQMKRHGAVVANRKVYKSRLLRRIGSRANKFIFGKLLFGLGVDIQSGLKLFRKEILSHLNREVINPWSFDIPLLFTTLELGYTIGEVDITFEERNTGNSKINLVQTAIQIASSALKLRFKKRAHYTLKPKNELNMKGAGVVHKRKRFITHTTLPVKYSALTTFLPWQIALLTFFFGLLVGSFYLSPLITLIVFIAVLSAVYFLDVVFNTVVTLKSLHVPPEISVDKETLAKLERRILPIYTILCPLYREAHVLPGFIEQIARLDWPRHRLEVILLLEEDDEETIFEAKRMNLPEYVKILVVPHSYPKTKPKALNYGLAHAKGKYVVVYDAEDQPDPMQLKTAYAVFLEQPREVMCLQAKLNYYNPHHNLLTRLFTTEYSLWFDMILPGLQAIETAIPLGGTSNHFRVEDLKKLRGWDAFNVTEDADLGARLFKMGGRTAIIDSITLEEANTSFPNWIRQRSRWLKGYLQTYFVHMRHPLKFILEYGMHAFIFQLIMGGKIGFMLINPILWLMTISYFVLYAYVGPAIEALYPTVVFYIAVISLVFGNFLYLYNYMIGTAKRGHWSLIKFIFMIPFYWLAISYATLIAIIQLIFNPHYWEKTHHGLHILKEKNAKALLALSEVPVSDKKPMRLPKRVSLLTAGTILAIASIIGNFFNFLYNAYLGRTVSIDTYGTVSLVSSFIYVAQIPLASVGKTVTWRTAFLSAKSKSASTDFWKMVRKNSFVLGVVLTAFWLIITPILAQFFHIDIMPLLLFTPFWIIGAVYMADSGFLHGNLAFSTLAFILVAEAITKFMFTVLFVSFGQESYLYAAIPLSMTIALLLTTFVTRHDRQESAVTQQSAFPFRFLGVDLFIRLSGALFISFDLLLVKHYLLPSEAGEYGLLTLPGKMIFFASSIIGQFIVPIVSREEGKGEKSSGAFYKLLALQSAVSCLAFLVLGVFGDVSVPLLLGERVLPVIQYLPIYGLAMIYFTTSSAIIAYHQIRKEYLFSSISLLTAFLQVVGIARFHGDIAQVVEVMFVTSSVSLLLTGILHATYGSIVSILKNVLEFFRLFERIPYKTKLNSEALRILIFNWRDTKHKWAGGAEVYIHELATRWVKEGHKVTVFCGDDRTRARNEVVEGVQIVRRGGFYTVYFWAFLYYVLRFRHHVDIVIDSENGMPFFTPLYVDKPKFLLIHHVHQEVFQNHLMWPLSVLARFIESKMMPLVYRNQKIITVSESSKKDILDLGFGRENDIEIVNPGVDTGIFAPSKKSTYPQFLYLGRHKAYKNVGVLIAAFARLVKMAPEAVLIIAGEGEETAKLKKQVAQLEIEKYVKFVGKVSESQKVSLMSSSWALVQPSSFEGWGITVIEANASKTPVIASNVAGLRDSVVDGHTGILVPVRDEQALIFALHSLIEKKTLRDKLSKQAYIWAQEFSWDKSSAKFARIIERELVNKHGMHHMTRIILSK